jgi:hypothetical protein
MIPVINYNRLIYKKQVFKQKMLNEKYLFFGGREGEKAEK